MKTTQLRGNASLQSEWPSSRNHTTNFGEDMGIGVFSPTHPTMVGTQSRGN